MAFPFQRIMVVLPMSSAYAKVAIAFLIVSTSPAASFARGGGHGGGQAGLAPMGGFLRPAGPTGIGNSSINGIPRGVANTRGWNNAPVDYSGISNAAKMATLPQPRIAAPALPAASEISATPPLMDERQALVEAPGGDRQPRANQVPSEKDLTNPNNPFNKENAVIDRTLNICRGC
jgi:hypothetical protein